MTSFPSLDRRGFLRSTTLALGGLAASAGSGLGAETGAGVGVGVPAARLARLGTGANICRWFRFPRAETEAHFADYIPASEAETIAAMGLRHVRLCVAPKGMMDPATGAVQPDRLRWLEAALRRFQAAGLLVMVDIHNEDRASELDPAWQTAFVRFWGSLAERLSALDPERTLLEFINEPVFDRREEEWNTLALRLAEAVRAKAPGHTLVSTGPNWGGIDGLRKVKLLPDRNVVYSFHCYDPFPFTHQGATWSSEAVKPLRGVPYPSSPEAVAPLLAGLEAHPASKAMVEKYGREGWDKARLAARFAQGIEWGRRNQVPLYCGEFGVFPVHAKAEHRANWFRDFGAVLAENGIGWAVWGWDEGFGLNRRTVGGKPVVDTVVAEALGLKGV